MMKCLEVINQWIIFAENKFCMDKEVQYVPDKDEVLRVYGREFEDVRCECGNKLMEVEVRCGSVVRIKCRKCKNVVRVRI
jgi:hypothetical protein|nr:MAG TPA: cysteine-rich protein [Caudoviricetes sp.]